MANDWTANVKKYAPDADDGVIAGIVRYCGIALQKVDSSLVSYSDPVELGRVRNNFLKKKCGLTDSDDVLDAAIAKVGERMKDDRTKNRVTVYYLLAEHFGLHHLFLKAAKVAKSAAPVAAGVAGAAALAAIDASKRTAGSDADAALLPATGDGVDVAAGLAGAAAVGTAAVAGLAGSGVNAVKDVADAGIDAAKGAADAIGNMASGIGGAAVAGTGAAVSGLTSAVGGAASGLGLGDDSEGKKGSLAWLWWLLLALGVLALLWWLFMRQPSATVTPPAAPVTTSASDATGTGDASVAAATPAAIPDGAGVVSEMRDGKPVVKVYFDTGKAEVVPAFAPATDALRTYLTANPGSKLGVSGFNDPTGNAAANAVLSRRRAEAVRTTLVEAGIPEVSIELVKPEATADATVSKEEARRVEVYIK